VHPALHASWLLTPRDDLSGQSPRYPSCRMMADDPNPCFWCLDGCNMECADLERQFLTHARHTAGESEFDEDLPF
jgi:hypothetical protein